MATDPPLKDRLRDLHRELQRAVEDHGASACVAELRAVALEADAAGEDFDVLVAEALLSGLEEIGAVRAGHARFVILAPSGHRTCVELEIGTEPLARAVVRPIFEAVVQALDPKVRAAGIARVFLHEGWMAGMNLTHHLVDDPRPRTAP